MIDLTRSYDDVQQPSGCCECGSPDCDGDNQWLESAAQTIADQIATALPVLEAPMLKLIKERNEARRLCELLAGSFPDIATLTTDKAIAAANEEMHQALWAYCKAKKHWDKRSYQPEGAR